MSWSSRSFSSVRSMPSKRTWPPAILSSRTSAPGLSDDAERLALLDFERDPVDGLDDSLAGVEVGLEVLDLQDRHGYEVSRVRGSRASRMPSAMKFAHMTSSAIARLGMKSTSGWSRYASRPSCAIEPQEAVGGLIPRQMKERNASPRTTTGSSRKMAMMRTPSVFGSKCLTRIRYQRAPTARAART